jgi:hypothetical protein
MQQRGGEKGMVRPEGVEPPTFWFVAKRSIQLSYGRTLQGSKRNFLRIDEVGGFGNPQGRFSVDNLAGCGSRDSANLRQYCTKRAGDFCPGGCSDGLGVGGSGYL